MIGRTNVGGGGSGGLNFQIVGGTATPASPKENTIWVNTDAEITNWAFSATEPEAPAAGMVWISTGKTSTAPFNALKKNNITIYPISAKQYISGAWVDKEAKSYQNGAWVEWMTYLYNRGNEFELLTGGWTVLNEGNATTELTHDCIDFKYRSADGAASIARTTEKITFPVAGCKTLKLIADVSSQITAGYPNTFGLTTNSSMFNTASNFVHSKDWKTIGTNQVFELDISNAKGDYYVALLNVGVGKAYEVRME